MLQSMRDGAQSTAAKVIIGLIVISFAGFGLESLLPGGSGTSVAEVNGEEISPQALQQAISVQKQRLAQIFGDQVDPAMLEDDRLRPSALESLIQRALMLQESEALGLTASQREIGRTVTSIEAFQIDGRFDPEQYKRVLATAGYTPERFRRAQAEDLVLEQLQQTLVSSEFVTPLESAAAANVGAEARDVRYIEVPADSLVAESAVDDAAVQAFYEENPDRFMEPLKLVAEYIVLDSADYIKPVDEAVLRDEFEAVRDEYVVKEESRVAHILLTQKSDESEADYQRRIAEVEVQLAADDADFGDLAKSYSDDIGSASLGGELGYTDGTAFPDAMEAAIAALEPGQISGPVETEAGTHFILVQDRVAGQAPDFESLRGELEYSIQTAEAQRELLLDADVLRDIAFNAADLETPAEAIGAEVQRSEPFSAASGGGLFANEALRAAAFSAEVFEQGNNSELIELSEGLFVMLRVAEQIEPQRQPLDEVKPVIVSELRSAAEREALDALVASVRDRSAAGETIEAIAKDLGYQWKVELGATRTGSLLPRAVLDAAFAMSSEEQAAIDATPLPGLGYALVQLARVTPGSLNAVSEAQANVLARQTTSEFQRATMTEFTNSLRASAEIITR